MSNKAVIVDPEAGIELINSITVDRGQEGQNESLLWRFVLTLRLYQLEDRLDKTHPQLRGKLIFYRRYDSLGLVLQFLANPELKPSDWRENPLVYEESAATARQLLTLANLEDLATTVECGRAEEHSRSQVPQWDRPPSVIKQIMPSGLIRQYRLRA
ncbi:MAG TPA: hypothetical protein VHA30_03700 [Patescibacteria group bacterium]|nr:hypothetical protein [Patescibacteria group bacterium]